MRRREADLFLDIGSTNIKWRTGGENVIHRTAFPPPVMEEAPRFEVDPDAIARIVTRIMDEISPSRVFFAVQMHGYVLLRKGSAVSNYISWRDERGANFSPDFTLTSEYGVGLKPNLPRLSLLAPHVQADELCTLGSYLVRLLTGCNRTHITDAAATGFYNVVRGTADKAPFRLPEATCAVECAGEYRGCKVYTPVGDMQAAVFGGTEGYDAERYYLLNLGTAGQMCAVSYRFVTGDFESRPYFHGKTLCTVTRLPGGASLRTGTEAERRVFFAACANALRRLPSRKKILAMGGTALAHRAWIGPVLERMGLSVVFCTGGEAVRGLELLSEEL